MRFQWTHRHSHRLYFPRQARNACARSKKRDIKLKRKGLVRRKSKLANSKRSEFARRRKQHWPQRSWLPQHTKLRLQPSWLFPQMISSVGEKRFQILLLRDPAMGLPSNRAATAESV